MDGAKCILQVRGVRPFLSTKYDIEKHPNYKYLSDADPSKAFNITEFVNVYKENKAKLLAGLNRKNTKHVRIEITEEDNAETADNATEKLIPVSAPVPPASAEEPISTAQAETPIEPANTQTEPTEPAEIPLNQTDNITDNYDDDEGDFDPDDTELI